MTTERAVVLAGGLGKRMRAADPDARLTPEQQAAADTGLKAMVPVHGRPFLDYILSSLADAGIRKVALVVAPDHEGARQYYVDQAPPARVGLSFVVQPQPLGTANAMLAAESWTAGDPFLTVNGDNLYPSQALADLARLAQPGLPAFERDDLIRSSNIPAERIKAFAVIAVDDDGCLSRIIEKPSAGVLPPEGGSRESTGGSHESTGGGGDRSPLVASAFRRKDVLISMNCWRFDSRIFAACRDVPRSARGEFELPEAVGLAIRRGVRLRALPAIGPVLDLSRRADAADVAARLAGITPRP
ncbi:MAG: nucleotidyltransferase family protein [Acidobacteriota bacterium]